MTSGAAIILPLSLYANQSCILYYPWLSFVIVLSSMSVPIDVYLSYIVHWTLQQYVITYDEPVNAMHTRFLMVRDSQSINFRVDRVHGTT